MWLDAVDLRDFYASPLGGVARRMIGRHLRAAWPDTGGLTVLGFGYATPYLPLFAGEAARLFAAMPPAQGVLPWPEDGVCRTLLSEEAELPLADLSVDRVLLVHGVECAEPVRPLMREIWRVLSGSGRLLVVAPNRRGIWARLERTPFGFGRPYTPSQLTRLLRDTMFTPLAVAPALFVPPTRSRMLLSAAPALETLGADWFNAVGGVVVAEATKQIYAATPTSEAVKRRAYATVVDR